MEHRETIPRNEMIGTIHDKSGETFTPQYQSVNKSVRKKDAMQLLLGKPVYMDDITPREALAVKLLRSPYPNAIVREINTETAKKVPGVEAVYTWEDVPQTRFAIAGQTYPEPSPYDRLIIDRHVRFAGDVVAIIAAETEKAADKAMKLIKVSYEVLEPVLDFRKAKDNPVLVHPEEDWFPPCEVGGSNRRNLVASGAESQGDVDSVMADCEIQIDRTFHTKAFNQAMSGSMWSHPPRLCFTAGGFCPGPWGFPRAGYGWRSPGSEAVSAQNRRRCVKSIPPL